MDLREEIMASAREYRPHVVLIEKTTATIPLISELRENTRLTVVPVQPKGDKATRMMAEVAAIESGRVLIPHEAPWLAELRKELVLFPNGKYDDQVDSVSQFLCWARNHEYGPPKITVTLLGSPRTPTIHDLFNTPIY